VDAWKAVGGAARGIAEADGKRAGLFCPGDGVVTRAARRPRTTSRPTGMLPLRGGDAAPRPYAGHPGRHACFVAMARGRGRRGAPAGSMMGGYYTVKPR
jgi:hypothetical protein